MESGCSTLISEAAVNSSASQADAMGRFPLVTISILNWSGWQDTLQCLWSVRRVDCPNCLTVAIHKGSWGDPANRCPPECPFVGTALVGEIRQ